MGAKWIIFFEKRVLFEWFRDRQKEQTHAVTLKQQEGTCLKLNPLFLYRFLFFLYDPLTTSLHGLKKSIIHGAIEQIKKLPTPQLSSGGNTLLSNPSGAKYTCGITQFIFYYRRLNFSMKCIIPDMFDAFGVEFINI